MDNLFVGIIETNMDRCLEEWFVSGCTRNIEILFLN